MAFPIRVERPIFEPHRCVVLGKGDDPVGWVDCGNLATVKPDPRTYVSHGGVLTAARLFGYDIPALLTTASRVDDLLRELDECKADLADANAKLDAIDVIESADFRARRKPGRKKEAVA